MTDRLCRNCVHYLHVPFTCGSCIRWGEDMAVRITDERTDGKCGPGAKYYLGPLDGVRGDNTDRWRKREPMTQAELKAHRKRQMSDTRDLTGRLMGDPIPGRRA